MEKTSQRFRAIGSTLAELNAEGLSAQTVKDLYTMYVGAASQHVLRVSFVPEHEARTFDTEVTVFWSQLIKRDATSPLFHLPFKLRGLGVGFSSAAPCGGPMASLAIRYPNTYGSHPDTDTLFNSGPGLRAQLVQLQTTLSQQMDKPALLLKPPALRKNTTQKSLVTSIQKRLHKSLKATPHLQSAEPSSSLNLHLTLDLTSCSPDSEADEAEDRCFRVSVARRLM